MICWRDSWHREKNVVFILKQSFKEEIILHKPKDQHEYLFWGTLCPSVCSLLCARLGLTSPDVAGTPGRVTVSECFAKASAINALPLSQLLSHYFTLLITIQPPWLLFPPWMSQRTSEWGSLLMLFPLSGMFSSILPLANFTSPLQGSYLK